MSPSRIRSTEPTVGNGSSFSYNSSAGEEHPSAVNTSICSRNAESVLREPADQPYPQVTVAMPIKNGKTEPPSSCTLSPGSNIDPRRHPSGDQTNGSLFHCQSDALVPDMNTSTESRSVLFFQHLNCMTIHKICVCRNLHRIIIFFPEMAEYK